MERIWLKNYPKGVPADIDYHQYRSVAEVFETSVAAYSERPAYHCMGKTITYAELNRMARAFGAWLQSRGLKKGDRVAIMMPNTLQYPVCIFGTLLAGGTVVNTNPLYTARELEHQLHDSGAEFIVVLENFASVLQQVLGRTKIRHVVLASLGDLLGLKGAIVNFAVRHVKKMVPAFDLPAAMRFNAVIAEGLTKQLAAVETGHDDIAFLQYTGGTTGVAKGAMLLHRNIVANVLQSEAWLKPFMKAGEPEVVITALPLYHIFSLTANCLVFMKVGGQNILITNPRDIPGFVKELAKHKFTAMTGVNTLFNALLNNADFAGLDFSHMRISFGGGMAVQQSVAERWKKATGVTLIEAYGLTETSPAATINPLDLKEWNGCIGLPVPSTELAIRDDAGKDLGIGEPGELCFRGPQVMAGYWQRPDETAKVMHRDGFFATGDIGFVNAEGFVKIVDRKKDMILVSGFNVYPNEVENEVAKHPGVLEVAAVGVPDEHQGESVKLFIVKKDPALTEQDVRDHCEKMLTGYKRPRYIEFRTELPKTNVGKILRRALRDEETAKGKKAA